MFGLMILLVGILLCILALVAGYALARLTEKIASLWLTERKYEIERDAMIVGVALRVLALGGVIFIIIGVFSFSF